MGPDSPELQPGVDPADPGVMDPAAAAPPRVEAMGPDSPELQPAVIDAEARAEIVAEARQEALGNTLSGLIDAQGLINDVQQGMSEGRSGAEAVTRAVARTYAGNAVSEGINGISDVRGTMAAAGMLPDGINNLMPDQAVANLVGTGMDGWSALGADAISSYEAGELDTTALDQFNQALRDRPAWTRSAASPTPPLCSRRSTGGPPATGARWPTTSGRTGGASSGRTSARSPSSG